MKIKKTTTIFGLLLLLIIFSPYTITKLTVDAEDAVTEILGEEYAQLEEDLLVLQAEEEEVVENLELENQILIDSSTVETEDVALIDEVAAEDPVVIDEIINSEEEIETQESIETVIEEEEIETQESIETVIEEEIETQESIETVEEEEEEIVNKFDPAIAPSQVSLKILLAQNSKTPDFNVLARFVGVGRDPVEEEIDKNGEIEVILETGRYYVELVIEDQNYKPENDLPAFFLLPNKEVDLEDIYLERKN